jgi:polar amino acid transport system substrate-binding protein
MDSIFAAVDTGKADFGGTLTETPERAAVCDFSHTVMPTTISVIVKSEPGSESVESFGAAVANSFKVTFLEEDRWKLILSGLGVTILISVCSGVLGTLIGYLTVLGKNGSSNLIHKLIHGYQALMGGIPIVVVLMVFYYIVFGTIDVAGEIVAILAFSLSFGATAGVTMWTAVTGIDPIQYETGLALGYTKRQVFYKIVFPQAAQKFVPQLMAQFVSLVKETSIVGYIAVQDLTRASDLIRARTMDAFFPLLATAIIYFVFCRILTRVLKALTDRGAAASRPRSISGVSEK